MVGTGRKMGVLIKMEQFFAIKIQTVVFDKDMANHL